MLEMKTRSSPTEGAWVVVAVEINDQFCSEDCYLSMTDPPERDSLRNVQVCLLCVIDNTEYRGMLPAQQILRKATRVDIVKLVKKFRCLLKKTMHKLQKSSSG